MIMLFSQIPEIQHIKESIRTSVSQNRIAQTQLITCNDGGAGLALAFSALQYIACEQRGEDACGLCVSCRQLAHGNYPELHVFFPFVKSAADKGKVDSAADLIHEFYTAFNHNPYITKSNWQQVLETGNKQFLIPVTEAERIARLIQTKVSDLKPRFFVIWLPEYLNVQASNKLLKTLEEPGPNTYFFLVSNSPDRLLPTLVSRCIQIKVPRISDVAIKNYLIGRGYDAVAASQAAITSEGSIGVGLENASSSLLSEQFGAHFAAWMRLLYMKKIDDIISWVDDVAQLNREDLKSFISFSSTILKQAFDHVTYAKPIVFSVPGFSLEKFAGFIKTSGIQHIEEHITTANTDLARNGNPRIILLSLSLNLFKYIG